MMMVVMMRITDIIILQQQFYLIVVVIDRNASAHLQKDALLPSGVPHFGRAAICDLRWEVSGPQTGPIPCSHLVAGKLCSRPPTWHLLLEHLTRCCRLVALLVYSKLEIVARIASEPGRRLPYLWYWVHRFCYSATRQQTWNKYYYYYDVLLLLLLLWLTYFLGI